MLRIRCETQIFDSKFESLSFESLNRFHISAVQAEFKVAASIPMLIGPQGLLSVGSIPTFGDLRICDVNKSEDFVARLLVGVYGSPAVDELDVKVSEWRRLLTDRRVLIYLLLPANSGFTKTS